MMTSVRGQFARYVSMNVLGMLGLSCYILADTFFVARGVGALGLAALNLALPAFSVMNSIGLMLGIGGGTRYAISGSKTAFTRSLRLAALAAAVLVAVGVFCPGWVARLLGAGADTVGDATVYLRVLLCFSPMFLLNNILQGFVRNDGAPRRAMTAMLVGSLSNVVLDYVFVFPCGLGMFGAALATGCAPVIGVLIQLPHLRREGCDLRLVPAPFSPARAGRICALGMPALIGELSGGTVILVFNRILLGLGGSDAVAAYGVVANLALVAVSINTGIAQGVQPLVSGLYGKGEWSAARRVLRWGLVLAAAVGGAVWLGCMLLAKPIAGIFLRGEATALVDMAARGLSIYFFAFWFLGINVVAAAFFSAVDRPAEGFWISLLRGFAVIIPMAFLLAALWGIDGVWLSMPVTEAAVLAVSGALLARLGRRGPGKAEKT